MKKIKFVLPLCVFFAFCSSSKKATAPVTPGISNVNVSRNDTMTSVANASSSFTTVQRDWAYTAKRDTSLNGIWVLAGIADENGTWNDTENPNKDSVMAATVTDTAMIVTLDTAATATNTGMSKKRKGKNKSNRKGLYDSAQARLNMDYQSTSIADTTVEPYKYWKRIPSVTFNATRLVFTGNTGCNSMSGSFNFNNKDIQFARNIATSKMSCNEYNENTFLTALQKADNYTMEGNILELKQGSTKLLAFKKS